MSEPLRVLYVSPRATMGGPERLTLDLLALHDRALVEPAVCFLEDGPLVELCRHDLGVTTYVVPATVRERTRPGRRAVRAIADVVALSRTELVHSATAAGHVAGGRAAKRAGVPAMWFQHRIATWRHHVDRAAAFVKSRLIIATSERAAQHQRRVNPLRRSIAVVHPGTRLPNESREQRRERGRAALGIDADVFVAGAVGRLVPEKDHPTILRAAASLIHARPARLVLLGSPPPGAPKRYGDDLRRLAADLGIADRVTFAGSRADMEDCLAALDVAVCAASRKPFSITAVEVLAAGTPLVAGEEAGVAEIVTPGRDALVFPSGDHEALAAMLLALCDAPERGAALAGEGERTARERFEVTGMVRRIEALYQSPARV
ncbi:MAG: glycosyltransferase family 4 protein [Gemmatimonadales bacterium]|jgi:glycosyltransferase involved in cell wall biosynthesis